MSAESTIVLFGGDQFPLLEMDWAIGQAIAQLERSQEPADLWPPGPMPVAAGQLTLGANQMLVWDLEPEPAQPSLLPAPALWETDPAELVARPRRQRRARRPRSSDDGSEQLGLF